MRVALRTAQVRLPISVAAIVAGLVGMLLMAAPAQATNEPEVDGFFYTVDASAGATVIGYDPATGTAPTIPAQVGIDSTTYPVTKIGDRALPTSWGSRPSRSEAMSRRSAPTRSPTTP